MFKLDEFCGDPGSKDQLLKNGIFLAENEREFINSRDEAIDTKALITLFRCGSSKNKSYCGSPPFAEIIIDPLLI